MSRSLGGSLDTGITRDGSGLFVVTTRSGDRVAGPFKSRREAEQAWARHFGLVTVPPASGGAAGSPQPHGAPESSSSKKSAARRRRVTGR